MEIEEPNISKAREELVKRNLNNVLTHCKDTRKLVRSQDKKIEDLEKLVEQQALATEGHIEQLNALRLQMMGTGATE